MRLQWYGTHAHRISLRQTIFAKYVYGEQKKSHWSDQTSYDSVERNERKILNATVHRTSSRMEMVVVAVAMVAGSTRIRVGGRYDVHRTLAEAQIIL